MLVSTTGPCRFLMTITAHHLPGIIHLLPHCAEAQEAMGPIGPNGGDYPLYLVSGLVTLLCNSVDARIIM